MEDKLKDIKIENLVICIYFVLLILYLYANKIEINYIYSGDDRDKENYRILLLIIFGISFIISVLFLVSNINELYEYEDSIDIYNLRKLSVIAGIFIVLASIIYLYIIYKDEDINLEVSP